MAPPQHILQVSELTKKVRFILENELNTIWLCGEISNFIVASSGHWYLSLKDSKSQVKCAMFKGSNLRVRIKPSNGQQVLVRARVSLYEPRGDFQLILEQMEDAGEGLLRQQYEDLKSALTAEGLFSLATKQRIPETIKTVGVVTSPTGAAIRDILSVMQRRNPSINIIIYPALVQGDIAKTDIRLAIHKANERNECDVLIVGRGGGSLEDLWSFNEEEVVRAIYTSNIPTISAVGHETDTTLADFVADLRAPTPSAAAELVSRDQSEISQKFVSARKRIENAIARIIAQTKRQSEQINQQLQRCHPEQKLLTQAQKSDELYARLLQANTRLLADKKIKPTHLSVSLTHLSPQTSIAFNADKVTQLNQRLSHAIERKQALQQSQFINLIEQLQLVSPLATIARGYSVTRDNKGRIIKNVEQVEVNDTISVQVSNGIINTKVI